MIRAPRAFHVSVLVRLRLRLSAPIHLCGLLLVLGLSACGDGGTDPMEPQRYDVKFVVFYDQNDNGLQDGDEHAVVPNTTVQVADRTALRTGVRKGRSNAR